MPKVIVIVIIIVLVLGVAGGAVFLLLQRSSNGDSILTEQENTSSFGVLQPAETGEQQALSDDDNDGLSNNDEVFWGTDLKNPDTDGDGYLDGEEVAADHDPTIPAPDDKLPVDSKSGQGTLPQNDGLTAGQYFVDDYDLSEERSNLTEKFEGEYGAGNRSRSLLRKFADEQSINAMLPRPSNNLLQEGGLNTAAKISQYLVVADNRGALANEMLYTRAQQDLREDNNSKTMEALISLVQAYRANLEEIEVPAAAVEVHWLLLGYTEALIDTFRQIAMWNNDPARSSVATRQLEVIDRKYYPIIRSEFQRLRLLQESLADTNS